MAHDIWLTEFGREYTERNTYAPAEIDEEYVKKYGITRTELNRLTLLDYVKLDESVLEVGANNGGQIKLLNEHNGFCGSLRGIDCNRRATEESEYPIDVGEAEELPYDNGEFDLVYTSGLLIHIPEAALDRVLDEIIRVSKRWVWGFEYYSDRRREIPYRGYRNVLWTDDYARYYERKGLRRVAEVRVRYVDSPAVDAMYLFEKGRTDER
jgi:ubiquinone/menaquinone biosynthesis C-methylase UbiE